MNVLSLFSGVGGFDLGLENAGMKTIYQCEWDKHATRILERHWPTVPRWGDITTLTAKEILSHGTAPDVVAWGSPCQDLSVAGKRAGLEGERSGLFHEGIRIINELRKETNNEYPKISIWENVAGALSSNRGADFGVIIDEMAKAGAMVIEWGLLDAQHFGIPQRRRRVFCIAIFNSATATNCPNPLLPIGESLRGNPKKGKPKRKSSTNETSESVGASGQWAAGTSTDGDILRTSITSKWSKGSAGFSGSEFYNMVVENDASDRQSYAESSFGQFKEGDVAALKASGGVLGGGSETLIAEPYVKSRRAQTATDDETWVPGEVNPTLNSFDVGDTRATTAIIQQSAYAFDSLSSNSMKSSNPDSGCNEVDVAKTLDTWRPDPSLNQGGIAIVEEPMLIDGTRVDDVRVYEPPVQTLGARMGTGGNNVPNVMQYDGYNQRLYQDDVALTIRIGRDSSDFIAQPTEPTMAVRRLTPLECERLMGWPDDHTRYKADGTEQADTHRYKQCGNGVASPVAEWIGKQLMKLDEATE
jgi:DNA (cytosine-5)-methyltransferase 1